jgi:hypothetical protein
MSHELPVGFESLEPFVQKWAQYEQDRRQSTRLNSTAAEIRAFYDAMLPHMPAALTHVDTFELGKLPEPSRRLYSMMLSMAEVAPHVELYRGDPRVPHSFDETRFIAEHGKLPHF